MGADRKPDSYRVQEVSCDRDLAFVVMAEWVDEHGDVDETEDVADFKSEAAAERHAARLTAALSKAGVR